ncbi:hypothetical protein B0F90DRAFT_1342201 [Multifurca ochricompacta]|uniref:Uncharacterized protein n=1 Tax=Multifurca ochricompacta TaxID=376703 RepID=A0AAD4LXA6_9AGAM|nr:hypothetical protein B0F90DRAFT_1342201 [Multifurca ochricompacta]
MWPPNEEHSHHAHCFQLPGSVVRQQTYPAADVRVEKLHPHPHNGLLLGSATLNQRSPVMTRCFLARELCSSCGLPYYISLDVPISGQKSCNPTIWRFLQIPQWLTATSFVNSLAFVPSFWVCPMGSKSASFAENIMNHLLLLWKKQINNGHKKSGEPHFGV